MSPTALHARPILVVDDDEDLRDALVALLTDEGYEAIPLANGREALTHLGAAASKPALILLDLMMPVMDGWEVLRRLRSDPATARIPVIVFTAKPVTRIPEATFHLEKPVAVETLLDAIDRALDWGSDRS